jgi:hypothetical protein
MAMNMQHEVAMNHGQLTWICSLDTGMQTIHGHGYGLAAWTWTCRMDMYHGHIDMYHGHRHATWTCSLGMGMHNGHKHAQCTWTCSIDSRVLHYPLSHNQEWLPQPWKLKRATHLTNRKQVIQTGDCMCKAKHILLGHCATKQRLIGQRASRVKWRVKRVHWRAANVNISHHKVKN